MKREKNNPRRWINYQDHPNVHRIVLTRLQNGVTLDQAHEIFMRFFVRNQSAPAVATEMRIDYKTTCDILYGVVWPQAYKQWSSDPFN
ncbi:hypothetical protein SAMN02982919_02261 [Giesbergeria anulus]|uniref:Uncharacterized protein n=1 Tax=Giesbergeria anulus TaxID=180197 RepID=A0A1H9NMD0_9BURK|nr:hypothetical protein SAMN02982919_02261 [Giesbergeria anulus]